MSFTGQARSHAPVATTAAQCAKAMSAIPTKVLTTATSANLVLYTR